MVWLMTLLISIMLADEDINIFAVCSVQKRYYRTTKLQFNVKIWHHNIGTLHLMLLSDGITLSQTLQFHFMA